MRVLLIRLDHSGDVVLTIPPVCASLRASDPGVQIDVLTTSIGAKLLDGCSDLDRRIAYDAPWCVADPGTRTSSFSYGRRLLGFWSGSIQSQLGGYDAILYLSFTPWEKVLTWRRALIRIGLATPYPHRTYRWADRLLTIRIPFDPKAHLVANCHRLVETLYPSAPLPSGVGGSLIVPRLQMPRAGVASADSVRIVLHTGHPDSPKSWMYPRFVEVAESLCNDFDARCLLTMSPAEAKVIAQRYHPSDHPRISAVVTQDLDQYASVVSQADLVVASDGGPAHIAAAMGIPTVVLFGPTDERVFAPLGAHVAVVRQSVQGAPCSWPWRVQKPCCEARSCLGDISAQIVVERSVDLLRRCRSVSASAC